MWRVAVVCVIESERVKGMGEWVVGEERLCVC